MAYSQNFPAQRPSFMFDASNAGRIPPNMTYSRASTANVFDGAKHKSSENLIAYSNPVTSQWTETNTAITVNALAAPDGTTTASNVLETAATGYHETRETFACTNAVSHTATFYAKANGRTVIRFLPRTSSGVIANVEFTLSGAGSESLISGTATRSIAAVGSGGWYKLTITFTGNATATGEFQVNICESAGTDSYAGDATKGVYLWGAQVATTGESVLNGTSGQIHREYAPSLVSKANNAARFETATDGQSVAKGILLEGQSTNLATYGSDLTNAAWNPLSAFIGGTAVGPDGTLSAVKLVASAGSSLYPRFRRLSLLTDTTQTFSIYVKPLELQHLAISADGSGSSLVQYNLSGNGAITSATGATGAVEQCGNGWFRVSFSYTTVPNAHLAITMQSSTTYQAETGNGYDGMLFALAMLENSSHASSFIGTTSSTATRAADSLSCVLSEVGYTGGPVTLITENTFIGDDSENNGGTAPKLYTLSNGSSTNNQINVQRQVGSDKLYALIKADNTTSVFDDAGSTATTSSTVCKLAISVGSNDYAGCFNGGTVSTDTSVVLPDGLTQINIGSDISSNGYLNGHYKRIAIYSEALSDSNLQSLTAS